VATEHPLENGVAPLQGLGVAVGVAVVRDTVLVGPAATGNVDAVRVRLLHHAGDRRRLRESKVRGGGREVAVRSGLDAVDLAAEARDIQVAEKDVVLRVVLLDLQGVAHLTQLALDALGAGCDGVIAPALVHFFVVVLGVLRGGVDVLLALLDLHVLHILLRDRRRAAVGGADRVAEGDLDRRTEVHAAVSVEVLVLAGEDRIEHHRRDLVEVQRDAVLLVERRQCDGVAVASRCVDRRLLHGGVDLEVLGQLLEDREGGGTGDARHCEDGGDAGRDEEAGDDAEADEPDETAEHALHRAILLGHTLDRKGVP